MADQYRIDYTITRRRPGEDDFAEIGFGSSGAWDSVDFCAHMVNAAVTHNEWETTAGMPDPDDLEGIHGDRHG